VIAIIHFGRTYLEVIASLAIIGLSACMLAITMQQPENLMVYFETTGKEIVFTWRMRSIADVVQILFLISCGLPGKIMAVLTGIMLSLTFSLAQKRPDIFRELFRKHAGDPELGEGDGGADGYNQASV
jgi:hypothetical protein